MAKMCAPRYRVRFAETKADLLSAQALRHRCFRGGEGFDRDAHDEVCRHILIEHRLRKELVACLRILPLSHGEEIGKSYSALFYDLKPLSEYGAPLAEIGRFCISPSLKDGADVLRLLWGELTRYVDEQGIGMLFGCVSFQGTDVEDYLDTFDLLRDGRIAPRRWRPLIKSQDVFRFSDRDRKDTDRKRGLRMMPPLLRTYLAMGGWVSDHAVVDEDLGTLHVFTGVEISSVPQKRAQMLRAAQE
ncbi:GNAT family N-acetyltransferase [Aliiroseovarius sp. KMU-50]|uniref:L-ornithine N(alpha)-acyltransferase n=1 Tax=Aliiroseovarius salicola TaxID=3009082 RepID=A0ABT4W3F3_9RHOB|nr:GNAT family N-acetyltransferase [Aliiroseovarius sp. KMU-50]MDA5094322.1 GNAT family N-acetyltransferase [Aliiroseovarius sp. KMU-50]